MDVFSQGFRGSGWYENMDGQGTFGKSRGLAAKGEVVDLDQDGDVDFLSVSPISWYENDGHGTFSQVRVISTEDDFALADDLDVDGDIDVVTNSGAWYENDGNQNFTRRRLSVDWYPWNEDWAAVDLDADGDADIVAQSAVDALAWYENRLAGDVDDNGEVQFADFVTLAVNFGNTRALWEEGDFDGDGVVQFSDFVILASNFGSSRQGVVTLASSSTSPVDETLLRADISVTDDFFERFDDQLLLENSF